MRRFSFISLAIALLTAGSLAEDTRGRIEWLLSEQHELVGVPFADVVYATTGRRILPVDTTNPSHLALVKQIGAAMDEVLERMNRPNSPARRERRINEASSHFETALKDALNRIPGLRCDHPKTASGRVQRSGYPDLRLVDTRTGVIVYLDPKLHEKGSAGSAFRTFYYEPKRETNKILDDAHHLVVGIEHDGRPAGSWRFLRWQLVDLSGFRVQLKAEFQGANRDLYRESAVVGRSESPP